MGERSSLQNGSTRLSLRAYARHAGVAPSRIHRLIVEGAIPRGADGLIDVATADQVMAERRAMASPLLMELNAERKRRSAVTKAAPPAPTFDRPPDEDDDDGEVIDPVFADACLDAQANLMTDPPEDTALQRVLAASELRLAHQQADVLGQAFGELNALAGARARDPLHRAALGRLFGRLRALLDAERTTLEHELSPLLPADRGDAPTGRAH